MKSFQSAALVLCLLVSAAMAAPADDEVAKGRAAIQAMDIPVEKFADSTGAMPEIQS